MGEIWRRLLYLFERRRMERELQLEMEAHRAEMGEPQHFGSTLKLREEAHDAWGFGWLERLMQDLRYAMRGLRRSPGFTLTALAVLAIGIGLNVTAFGILNAAMFRPLPGIDDAPRVVRLTRRSPSSSSTNVSYPSFDFYARHQQVLTPLFAEAGMQFLYGEQERWRGNLVTPGYFAGLGVGASLGGVEMNEPGDIVLSAKFFESRFGSDASVIGRIVRLNNKTARVVGIAASEFLGLEGVGCDLWGRIEDHAHFFEGSQILQSTTLDPLHVFARLKPGWTVEAAEAALRPLVDERRKQSPAEIWDQEFLRITPGAYLSTNLQKVTAQMSIAGILLLLVLLTACANLGNLLLARSVARQREISIRMAVGASRWRVVRQLMTESLLLAMLGAACALALSTVISRLIAVWLDWPSFIVVTPDWRVILFSVGTGFLAAMMFGLAPALAAVRANARRSTRLRLTLVGAQAAACCVLLIVSGLLVRGLWKGTFSGPGFVYAESVVVDTGVLLAGKTGDAVRVYFEALDAKVRAVPGVEATALATVPPLGQRNSNIGTKAGPALLNSISPNYFVTMGIDLRFGRTFAPGDKDVIIVGERLAARLWPNENPLGKEYRSVDGKLRWAVVGVAADAPIYSPGNSDAMEMYRPLNVESMGEAALLVRTRKLDAALESIRKAGKAADPAVLTSYKPMREGMARRLRNSQAEVLGVGMLAGITLLLALVGFVGLIAFTVTQRTREIGVRLAMGATRFDVMRVGLDRILSPTLVGLLAGIVLAAAMAKWLRSELYGLSNLDPVSYVAAPVLFLACALLFSLAPLRRAARVDPATALRHDS